LCLGDSVVGGEPTFFAVVFWKVWDVGERCESRDKKGTFHCLQNAGISVINRAVKNRAGIGP
jgi:hypothetical protein